MNQLNTVGPIRYSLFYGPQHVSAGIHSDYSRRPQSRLFHILGSVFAVGGLRVLRKEV
jgi:hypothetical protein